MGLITSEGKSRTVLSSSEKKALRTMSRWPENDFGMNPSRGSRVYSLAVMSLDVVMKYLGS
jgi:hypothetical protein